MPDHPDYVQVICNFTQGYPLGPDLFYQCTNCGDILPSMPGDNLWCSCYMLAIDIDAGRLALKDDGQIKLLRIETP